MITKFETQNPADNTALKGILYTPDNPVAVMNLVHGFGEHSGRYLHMMDALGEKGIAVAAIDLRGHGKSSGKRGVCHSYDLLRGDAESLLRHSAQQFPELPHFLYGHSMGGGLVLNHVLNRGVGGLSGVIVSAPLLTTPEPLPKPLIFIVRLLKKIAPNVTLGNPIGGDKISTISEEQTAYESDAVNHGRLGVGLADGMLRGGEWVLSQAENWNAPLLLMHAKGDQLTSYASSEAFASRAQNCTFRTYPDSQHEIHNDISRADVYKEITTFIQGRL